jgi:hypothetical protein
MRNMKGMKKNKGRMSGVSVQASTFRPLHRTISSYEETRACWYLFNRLRCKCQVFFLDKYYIVYYPSNRRLARRESAYTISGSRTMASTWTTSMYWIRGTSTSNWKYWQRYWWIRGTSTWKTRQHSWQFFLLRGVLCRSSANTIPPVGATTR